MRRGTRTPGLLDRLPDQTAALLAEGYWWAARACAADTGDVRVTRLLGRRTVVVRGPEAAREFYDGDLVRAGAAPRRLQRTLFGAGGVQGLDGARHRARKSMLLDLLGPPRAEGLAAVFAARWREALPDWERRGQVVLFEETGRLLCAAVCDWSGVPVPEGDLARRTRQLEALIDAGSGVAARYRRGVRARRELERWCAGLVREVRRGALSPPQGTALQVLAAHRDPGEGPLDERVAAVDLLNVLRPTVAIDRYVVFAALALHENPAWATRIAGGDDDAALRFVQEVRRVAPFFPVAAARAAGATTIRGVPVPAGARVLLDLFGTDRDPGRWPEPDRFDPDRFAPGHARVGEPDLFSLVPQGGGRHDTGHRCAGEWVTVAVMEAAVRLLTREMVYRVPPQDLRLSARRMPTLPASGLRLTAVRRVAGARSAPLRGATASG